MLLPIISSLANQSKTSSGSSTGSSSTTSPDFNSLLKDMIVSSMMSANSMGGLTGSSESDSLFGSSDSSGFISSGGSSLLGNPFLTALSSITNIKDVPQEKLLPLMMLGLMGSSGSSGSTSSSSSGMGDTMMAPIMLALFQKMFSGDQPSTLTSPSVGGATQAVSQSSKALAARSAYGDSLASAAINSSHVNQFDAELLVGGDGTNADCGPTSLVMALRALRLKVKGETSSTNNGAAVDLARLSMVIDTNRDGVDGAGNRSEAEHSTFTDLDDITRGAKGASAKTEILAENAQSIRQALQRNASVVVTGTFVGKSSLPWTGDRGIDNSSPPGGAGRHIIAVTGYDASTNQFLVQDPARSTALMVSESNLNDFMSGNAGALAIYR